MTSTSSELSVVPLSHDVPGAVELSRAALIAAFSRSGTGSDAQPRIASVTAGLRSGEFVDGRLCLVDGKVVGVALWDVGHPRGILLQTLFVSPGASAPRTYAGFLEGLDAQVGPPVFSPGGLVGLSEAEEDTLMRARGYDRFARSEMRWPPAAPVPPIRTPVGVGVRPVQPEDEPTVARLHLAAFGGTFDQSIYLSDPDPVVDASRAVHEMMSGRFGEWLGWASSLAEQGGRPVGASLVVRAPFGPLLISVMVAPDSQGSGIGRALVLANLHALRARGETVAALNVTEGNTRAVALYEHLGFVRTLGPEHSWYARAAVPVGPGEGLTRPSDSVSRDTRAAEANRTRRT